MSGFLFFDTVLAICPPLDSAQSSSWFGCANTKSLPGYTCSFSCRSGYPIGTIKKVCHSNGTWTPLSGAYCGNVPRLFTITCPGILNLNTLPAKATADARGKFANPISDYPESEFKMQLIGAPSIDSLPTSNKKVIRFTITNAQHGRQSSCEIFVAVNDNEPPMVRRCPEEIHYVIPYGLYRKIHFDRIREIRFFDGVIGDCSEQAQTVGKDSNITASFGEYVTAGQWTIAYKGRDYSNNEAFCRINIRIKSRPCKMNSMDTGSDAVIGKLGYHRAYQPHCKNGSRSMCDGFNTETHNFEITSCRLFKFGSVYFGGDDCRSFTLKPLPSCVNNSDLLDVVNGSCPNGTIKSYNEPYKCFPCERSMFFNFNSKKCQLCPDNTTTYTLGNTDISNCIPCPKHQMTKLSKAPRFCEDICNPGSWLDASNTTCTKCPRGSYAAPGARSCTKCPNGLTTLSMASTDAANCVAGSVIDKDSGFIAINKDNITNNNVSLYHLRINWSLKPLDQINQLLAFKFKSSYLKQLSNCSKGYIRLYSIVSAVEFRLTENICGSAIEEPIFVRVMKDQPAFVEFHFTDVSAAQVSFRFGVANCSVGYYFNFTSMGCVPCAIHTFRKLYTDRVCQKCQPGTAAPIPGAFICQDECPKGTMRVGEACQNCPIGFYQDEPEKTMCKKCPNGTSTWQSRTANITGCIDACGAGQYKHGNSCLPCPVGMFQAKPVHAFKMCIYCHSSNTTMTTGSSSCVEKCSYEGEYYNRTESKCKKCPIGTYKLASLYRVDACTPCPTNHTTNRIGAASITECVDMYDHCSPNPCNVPAWCEDTGPDFKCHCPYWYSGRYCEKRSHPCESSPCQNNATCYDYYVWNPSTYYCECRPGSSGKNCETAYNACSNNPCQYGNCTVVNNDFKCVCPPWHSGRYCEYSISKPCSSQSCSNRGNCINGPVPTAIRPATYTCNCSLGYTGKDCETKINYCVNNTCDKTGTLQCRSHDGYYTCLCKMYYRRSNCSESFGCDPGEYMVNEKCFKCKKGSYQLSRNRAANCLSCDAGETTFKEGSTRYAACVVLDTLAKLVTTLKITSETWTDKLLDKTSSEFKSLASKWETAITELYRNEADFKNVVVTSFRKGSVVSIFTVYFNQGVKNLKEQFSKKIESGTVGNFTVNKNSLIAEESDGTKVKTPKDDKKSYTLMIVLIVVGVLLVVVVIFGFLIYKRNKQRIGHRSFKISRNDEKKTVDYPMDAK
eukprot:gene13814-15259_t